MKTSEKVEGFLAGGPYAVVGASADRAKYGNKVLRVYLQRERLPVFPVNLRVGSAGGSIEGVKAYATLADAPARPRSVSIITPPEVTERVVQQAIELGVEHLWMQPGAESARAVQAAEEAGLSVIADGTCILVVLGYRETD